MSDLFFDKPILNSPYAYPARHWELDADGQPTQQIMEWRRSADFITPIPKPRKRKGKQAGQQQAFVIDEGKGLSTLAQQYDSTAIINRVRVDDGHGDADLLNLVVEIKGHRGEDAKKKKSTMETYWGPA